MISKKPLKNPMLTKSKEERQQNYKEFVAGIIGMNQDTVRYIITDDFEGGFALTRCEEYTESIDKIMLDFGLEDEEVIELIQQTESESGYGYYINEDTSSISFDSVGAAEKFIELLSDKLDGVFNFEYTELIPFGTEGKDASVVRIVIHGVDIWNDEVLHSKIRELWDERYARE